MTPRQARLGVDIFTFLVAASVGVALAGVVWRLLDRGVHLPKQPIPIRRTQSIDIAPLIALAPFGTGGGAAAQASGQPLTLRGILLTEPRTASSALISLGDAAPVAFFAGQNVGNATVEAIAVDHVILTSGGVRSTLAFPDPATASASPAPLAPAPVIAAAPPPPTIAAPSPSAAAMLQSFGAVASGAGLSVSSPNTMMRLAGLQAGDQIVAINGAPANELLHNPALLQPILATGTARIDIVRAGQRITVAVPVK